MVMLILEMMDPSKLRRRMGMQYLSKQDLATQGICTIISKEQSKPARFLCGTCTGG